MNGLGLFACFVSEQRMRKERERERERERKRDGDRGKGRYPRCRSIMFLVGVRSAAARRSTGIGG